jgi:hypothetical protein
MKNLRYFFVLFRFHGYACVVDTAVGSSRSVEHVVMRHQVCVRKCRGHSGSRRRSVGRIVMWHQVGVHKCRGHSVLEVVQWGAS